MCMRAIRRRPFALPALSFVVAAALAALAPSRASSAPPATAEEALALHAASLGPREAIGATRSLRLVGRVQAFGLPGTVETIVAAPGDMVQSMDLGVVTQKTGISAARDAWGVDPNGKARALDGNERDAIVTEAWFASLAYLGAGGAPANESIALLPSPTDTIRLAVTPPGGRPRVLHLDPNTGDLLLTVEVHDVDTMTVTYGDYRAVDGLRLPFRARQTTGNSAYDVTIELDSIERNGAINPSLFAMPRADARDVRFAREGGADRIPISLKGAHILTSVRVNGRGPYTFFLDTGAGASCLNAALAESLGLPSAGAVEARGVSGSTTVSYVRVDSLAIGGATLLSQTLVALPLEEIGTLMEASIDGILGYDFFSRFAVRIDYEKKIVSLAAPDAFTPPAGVEPLPITLESNVPAVRGVVNGRHDGLFRIDTGSGSSLDLHGPFVAEHRLLETARRVAHRPFAGVGGVVVSAVARLDTFAIGPYVMRDLVTGHSEVTEGVFASTSYAGNIGGGVLRRFTVTLDYEGKRIFLEPNARFDERDPYDRSGLATWRDGDARRALHVEEGTPAWRAGIREGDRIVAVNGRAARRWRDDDLARALRAKPGTRVSVKLERDGKTRTVRFRLEEIL